MQAFIQITIVLILLLSVSTDVFADSEEIRENLNYRGRVISVKKNPIRPKQDTHSFEIQFELMTEAIKPGRCAFPKGSRVMIENLSAGIYPYPDAQFIKPGMEMELVCEFQRYKQNGEQKEITYWSIWEFSPSIRYKNESSLVVSRGHRELEDNRKPPHICSGSLGKEIGLERVGLSPELVAEGVECVAADFDGNGYFDFALFPPYSRTNGYKKALVLFFKKKKIIKISELENPPTQLCRANFGCFCLETAQNPDGLQQGGGGESDRSVVFIQKTGKWEIFSCGGCEA